MQEVDIYLYISSKAPTCAGAKYKYILTCGGHTLEDTGETGQITGHRLAMTCAIEALKRMTRAAVITIHTNCRYLMTGHVYLASWERNGWKKAGGEPLKNADLWQQLYELSKGHAIRYQYKSNMDHIS